MKVSLKIGLNYCTLLHQTDASKLDPGIYTRSFFYVPEKTQSLNNHYSPHERIIQTLNITKKSQKSSNQNLNITKDKKKIRVFQKMVNEKSDIYTEVGQQWKSLFIHLEVTFDLNQDQRSKLTNKLSSLRDEINTTLLKRECQFFEFRFGLHHF